MRERGNVGRAILLGLEFLIIADIVMTIIVDPTLERAAALCLIVLVRTFLSFSLKIEFAGSLPWPRRAAEIGTGPQARIDQPYEAELGRRVFPPRKSEPLSEPRATWQAAE